MLNMNRTELNKMLAYEKEVYKEKVIYSKSFFLARLKNEMPYRIWKWQRLSRLTDFYKGGASSHSLMGILNQFLYLYYIRRKHKIGERLGLEIGTANIGEGLIVFHCNNVINGNAIIGENCHIKGTVVVGNNGKTNDAPIIGNNVMIGAGAKVIGNISIADNIKIAAGAVVVDSFIEPGITIGGIPARKLK